MKPIEKLIARVNFLATRAASLILAHEVVDETDDTDPSVTFTTPNGAEIAVELNQVSNRNGLDDHIWTVCRLDHYGGGMDEPPGVELIEIENFAVSAIDQTAVRVLSELVSTSAWLFIEDERMDRLVRDFDEQAGA
jgi:hypothetical protein